MAMSDWFAVRKPLVPRRRFALGVMSFVIPLLIWSLISYVPFIWHPDVRITRPGGVSYFTKGMLIDKKVFKSSLAQFSRVFRVTPGGQVSHFFRTHNQLRFVTRLLQHFHEVKQ